MKRKDCSIILMEHFAAHPNTWVKKTECYVIAGEFGHSPESIGRRLRDLEEEGKIKVGYYDGKFAKGLAQYCLGEVVKKVSTIRVENGVAYMV